MNFDARATSSFSADAKSSSVFTGDTRIVTEDLLLMENGSKLLLESGFGIILEQSTPGGDWAFDTKN